MASWKCPKCNHWCAVYNGQWVCSSCYDTHPFSVTRHEKSGGGGDMAKQAADHYTPDMLQAPKRGRPRKPDALTPAQRAKAYRARNKADPMRMSRLAARQRQAQAAVLLAELRAKR